MSISKPRRRDEGQENALRGGGGIEITGSGDALRGRGGIEITGRGALRGGGIVSKLQPYKGLDHRKFSKTDFPEAEARGEARA